MASEESHPHEIIIIKRVGGGEEEAHHGGAWKIAFADFMTAMMAFFLVLWIINATSKDTKTVIARYFNPVKLEDPAKAKKGIVQDSSKKDDDKSQGSNSGQTNEPKDAPAPGPGTTSGAGAQTNLDNQSETGPATTPSGHAKPASKADEEATRGLDKEDALFVDPYASLDRIASSPSATAREADAPRAPAKVMTDPFRPITLGSTQDLSDTTNTQIVSAHTEAPADRPDALLFEPQQTSAAASPAASLAPPLAPAPDQTRAAIAPPPAPALSATAPTDGRPVGEPATKAAADAAHARAVAEAKQVARQLQNDIQAGLSDVASGPSVQVEASDDGFLISVTDKMNFSMFSIGSAEPQQNTLRIMTDIAGVLKKHKGQVIVRGFTDARPFASTKYDNWRLSSARAQMAYYMLVRGGVPADRFERIEGYGDRRLRDPQDKFAAVNRRIEILVRPEKP